jgi:SAM-dependent methyltransferase
MKRVVMPEILDGLEPADSAAIHSRRDLQRLNAVMGHLKIMAVEPLVDLSRRKTPRIVDLGGGDGTFLFRLSTRISLLAGNGPGPQVEAVLVDRHPVNRPVIECMYEDSGSKVEVIQADVFDWLEAAAPADAILANLFLHHFQEEALARLLELVARKCDLFVACEPRRAPLALTASRLLWVIGCNAVTRHDAAVSVRAGFRGQEISALWPANGWKLREEKAGWFSHLLVAEKK